MSHQDSTGTSSVMDESWISWYCSMNGNHVLCEADKQFVEDSFNLFGLKQFLPKDFSQALATILDRQDQDDDDDSEDILQSSSLLYGLIHARFIVTTNGLQLMQRKFVRKDFGECPRAYCNGQAVLPVGLADEPHLGSYKLFCPKCRDLYNCPISQRHIDGAFFGSSFPHIFLMTYENIVPSAPTSFYVPRVFGFKIHASSGSLPKRVVVLDSANQSNGELASSDEVNFASSLENGNALATMRKTGCGDGVPIEFDLTYDASIPERSLYEAGNSYVGKSCEKGAGDATTLETLETAAKRFDYGSKSQVDVEREHTIIREASTNSINRSSAVGNGNNVYSNGKSNCALSAGGAVTGNLDSASMENNPSASASASAHAEGEEGQTEGQQINYVQNNSQSSDGLNASNGYATITFQPHSGSRRKADLIDASDDAAVNTTKRIKRDL